MAGGMLERALDTDAVRDFTVRDKTYVNTIRRARR